MNYLVGRMLKSSELEVGKLIVVTTHDEEDAVGVIRDYKLSDSQSLISVTVLDERSLSIRKVFSESINGIYEARPDEGKPMPAPPQRVPNELYYIDVLGKPNLMKVGNPIANEGDAVVTAITLEQNGMVVVHGKDGIIAVIKSERTELYYS